MHLRTPLLSMLLLAGTDKQGRKVEVYVHPITGAIVEVNVRVWDRFVRVFHWSQRAFPAS